MDDLLGEWTTTDTGHRRASIALGVASVLIAVLGVLTATRGPAELSSALAGPPPAPPLPAAQVSVTAGTMTIPDIETGAVAGAPAGGPVAAGPVVAAGPINPTVPVTVAVAHGALREVQLTDAKSGKAVPGALEADGHSWHSTAPLGYAGTYQLAATAVGEDQREVRDSATVKTIAPAVLTSANFIPAPSASSVGVGQPLVVRFTHPIGDKDAAERALKVTSNPPQPGAWYWMSTSEVHYRPATYWAAGSTITLAANVFGVDLGNRAFGEASRTETIHVHDSWVAKADGATKVMQILHNGALVKTMPISLGSPKNPSHEGPHVVSDKQPSIVMDSCTYGVCEGDPGYYKEKVDLDVRISNDGEFVHAAPWSVGQQGSSNVSHGCVNLSPANAAWFYKTFGVGDVVEITHSGGPPLPVWDTYGDWELSWPEWQARGAAS